MVPWPRNWQASYSDAGLSLDPFSRFHMSYGGNIWFSQTFSQLNMLDWIVFSHIKGVVGAHHNMIYPVEFYKVVQLMVCKYDAVEVHFFKIGTWWIWECAMSVFSGRPCVINPTRIGGKVASTMGK